MTDRMRWLGLAGALAAIAAIIAVILVVVQPPQAVSMAPAPDEPTTPEAAPTVAQAAPATPEAAPATPQIAAPASWAAPATPQAAPATPEAAPATPQVAAPASWAAPAAPQATPQVAATVPVTAPPTPQAAATPEPSGPLAPEFVRVTQWLNSPALSLADLRGRVVLIDVWTFGCYNCRNTLPYLRDWHAKYASEGLQIVGVHTPEFEFEQIEANVREAMIRLNVTWPVAMDNNWGTWRAYKNRYWPRKYLVDQQGRIRYDVIGEGSYAEMERRIRELLTEGGASLDHIPVGGVDEGAPPAQTALFTGDSWDEGRFLSVEGVGGAARLGLRGGWVVESDRVRPDPDAGSAAWDATVVVTSGMANLAAAATAATPVLVKVTLDGAPVPEPLRGAHVVAGEDGATYVSIGNF
ncbi:MAG: redoxin domain-containing protein, partial [Chloroflexi bacterium]|nr:redoxin domain-containing protein [Chloroflexota bacterium]